MYKYSQVEGADKFILADLVQIIKAVKGKKFISLMLYGSYAKGEGGFVDNKPVNDYDLLLVGGSEATKKAIENVKLDVKAEVWMVKDMSEFDECKQQWFEIKYSGIPLAGEDIRPLMPDYKPYDIPYSDAINSLDKRVLSMLVGKYEMMKEDSDVNKVMTQINKMIIALGDAILIKRGQFNPSYRTRSLMLNEDGLTGLYNFAVHYKLFGGPEVDPDKIWAVWKEVQSIFRDYVIVNQIDTQFGEMLVNFDERIEIDTFKGLLEALGCGDWL